MSKHNKASPLSPPRHGMSAALGSASIITVLASGCGHDAGHAHGAPHGQHGGAHSFADADAFARVFDDPARDAWQQPDDVLRAMDLTPTMTVADVGAGTGYFAVRLARVVTAGAVIATDIEPAMVRHLEERARREQLTNLRAVTSTATRSGLDDNSVDRILIVHVWHHLDDRVGVARDLAAALRPGGRIFVVDFDATSTRGPPAGFRVSPEAIIADFAAAGLEARVSPVTPSGQYIVEAGRAR